MGGEVSHGVSSSCGVARLALRLAVWAQLPGPQVVQGCHLEALAVRLACHSETMRVDAGRRADRGGAPVCSHFLPWQSQA